MCLRDAGGHACVPARGHLAPTGRYEMPEGGEDEEEDEGAGGAGKDELAARLDVDLSKPLKADEVMRGRVDSVTGGVRDSLPVGSTSPKPRPSRPTRWAGGGGMRDPGSLRLPD